METRIIDSIEKITESGCWIWMGYLDPNGYGRISINNTPRLAHRVVYTEFRGENEWKL